MKSIFLRVLLGLVAFALPASGYVQLSPVSGGYYVTLTDAPTIAWDAAQGYAFKVTLGGDRTMGAPTGAVPGTVLYLMVIQDGTGNRTLDFAQGSVKFGGGVLPAGLVSTDANAIDVLTFLVDPAGSLLYLSKSNDLEVIPVVPDAPSGFTATINGANVDFAWTDNSDNETGFMIEHEDAPGVWFGAVEAGVNAVSISGEAATWGSGTHNFRIKAVNGVQSSTASNEDDVEIP